ncbi:18541_t:CDS:2, partial [Racocetra persica]
EKIAKRQNIENIDKQSNEQITIVENNMNEMNRKKWINARDSKIEKKIKNQINKIIEERNKNQINEIIIEEINKNVRKLMMKTTGPIYYRKKYMSEWIIRQKIGKIIKNSIEETSENKINKLIDTLLENMRPMIDEDKIIKDLIKDAEKTELESTKKELKNDRINKEKTKIDKKKNIEVIEKKKSIKEIEEKKSIEEIEEKKSIEKIEEKKSIEEIEEKKSIEEIKEKK